MTNNARFLAIWWVLLLLWACGTKEQPASSSDHRAHTAEPAPTGATEQPQGDSVPAAAGPVANGLTLGDAAPMTDRLMKNVDETELTIAAVAGKKGTLVVFTCNHCPFAQAWEDRITALGNEYGAKGVGVIAINANDTERFPGDAFEPMQARAKNAGMQFPYVVDDTSAVARAFGAEKTPEAFLFDADNHLVYRGAVDDNAHAPEEVQEHYLRSALEALVAGTPIAQPEVPAVGCSIKLRPAAA